MTKEDELPAEPIFERSNKYVREKIGRGIRNAAKAASSRWLNAAELCVVETAFRMRTFNVDYVWKVFRTKYPEYQREGKAYAMGPIMQKAEQAGIILSTGEKGYSTIDTKHHNPTIIWQSLIYGDPDFK